MPHDPAICPTALELFDLYPVFQAAPYTSGLQAWEMTVDNENGVFLVVVSGIAYTYTSTGGEAKFEIQAGILAVLQEASNVGWVASGGVGTPDFQVSSTVVGSSLMITFDGPPGTNQGIETTNHLTPEGQVSHALEFGGCLVCDWGCSTFDGCMAAAVHWLKMWSQGQSVGGGPSGQIASMGQGPFSVSFATSQTTAGADGWWGGSPEGMQFLFLRKQQGPRPINLRSGRACISPGPFGGRRSAVRRLF